jgi:hypothetical protein
LNGTALLIRDHRALLNPNMPELLTRAEFEQRRRAVKRVEQHDGRLLALVSVGLGVGQLIFLRWADTNLAREPSSRSPGSRSSSIWLAWAPSFGE